jgi:1,2-phenylacetyl-CoA epoxidase catalytic subunit
MRWVRKLPCAARAVDPQCDGHVQADHAGRRGLGQKADDRSCIPLCAKHHEQRASFHGPFRTWTQAQMRTWLHDTIEATQALYANLCSAEPAR